MENKDQITERYMKPNFDGRLNYHNVIKSHLDIISKCIISRDYIIWLNSLQSAYTIMMPFMKDPNEVGIELQKINKNVATSSSIISPTMQSQCQTILHTQLLKATQMLYKSAKDLFLQTGTDEQMEEFDVQRFLRECDV